MVRLPNSFLFNGNIIVKWNLVSQKIDRIFLYEKSREITRENILYHRNIDSYSISSGIAFRWPRSADEAMAITDDQYRMLMQGLEIVARHPISELKETPRIMYLT